MITISSEAGVALGKALAELEDAERHVKALTFSARRCGKTAAMDRLRQAREAFDMASRAAGREVMQDGHHLREGD